MRFLSPNKLKKRFQSGFTLIEILIIAPVVILVVSGFVALMITIVGDVLVTRDNSNMSFEVQDALDRIEQDTRLTTQFLATSGTQIAPQGSDSNFTGTAAFSSSNSLIMGSLTTDRNPADSARQLIFYAKQPNDCGALQIYNRVFQAKVIYFIKSGSLWRRAILPSYNTNAVVDDNTVCSVPWQRNTCSPGYGLGTRCETNDSEVAKNIKTFTVKYLSSPDSNVDLGAAQALNAGAIEVTLEGEKTTAGRTITTSGVIRGARLNNIDVELAAPTTPVVTGTANSTSAMFSWSKVPVATSYTISYNINGGGWVNATTDAQTTTYSVNAGQGNTVTIRVAARNSTGTSSEATTSVLIPLWYTPTLQGSWANYDTANFAAAGYTKTNANIVVLKGTVKYNSANPVGTTVFTLPTGYRPSGQILFQTDSNASASRVDITTNGEVQVHAGSSPWVTLDGIRFVASTAGYTWTTYTTPFQNNWTNYGGLYAPLRSTIDSVGRVHFQGLVKDGINSNPTTIINLPAGQQITEYTHIPAASTGFNYTAYSSVIHAKGIAGAPSFYALQGMFYPTTAGWTALPLVAANNWVVFDAGHTQPRYRKGSDGIVTVKGLIKNGVTTPGTVIANLPAGFRPKERICISGVSNGVHSRVDIMPNGQIIVAHNVYSSWTSLDNISFIAEQ